jgi:uncharacterized DUF497 family protein
MNIEFEWDEKKNTANIRKHGISFAEAKMAFFDPLHVEFYDTEHSDCEDRWTLFGMIQWVLVVVSFIERKGIIRIISARRATCTEEVYYYGNGTNDSK